MTFTVFDIETDGLDATKIHCFSYRDFDINFNSIGRGTITEYDKIKNFLKKDNVFVGHNIIRFDIPVLERLLNIKITNPLIDTLGLSWYLYSDSNKKRKHGLEYWGEQYNIPKPEIKDWKNLDVEDYIKRCQTDVDINSLLWIDEMKYLFSLYRKEEDAYRLINYLNFKLDCAREQEENPCYIDRKSCEENLRALEEEIEMRTMELSEYMPLQKTYKTITKPSNFYKKNGEITSSAEKWNEYLKEYNLPEDTESFEMLEKVEKGNPNSIKQLKEWLLSLGWKPTIYKETTSKVTGITRENPQISDDDGNICKNLAEMFKEYPYLSNLENLALMQHRKGIFESFLNSIDSENRVAAKIGGFTNSLRMQHRKPIVNLPKVGTYLGKEIRSLITTPSEDYLICGSDIHALEDTTKQHYMYFFDPEYVNQMRVPGFDPHLDIAKLSGLMTEEEINLYKELKKRKDKTPEEDKEFQRLTELRYDAKTLNFSCVPVDNTQVLTVDGWKFYSELSIGENIFSYNTEKDCLEIVPIQYLHHYNSVDVIFLKNNFLEFECTSNHRWFGEKRVRTRNNPHTVKDFFETKDIVDDCNIIQSAQYNNKANNKLSIEDCELLGWILSDGWFYWSKKSLRTSASFGKKKEVTCGISQKKYIAELESLLIKYPHYLYIREDGVHIYLLKENTARDFLLNKFNFGFYEKDEIDYTNLIIGMSFEQRERFLYSFHLADGGVKDTTKLFYQNRGTVLDSVILALTLNGYSFNSHSNGMYKERENLTISVKNRRHFTGQRLERVYSRNTEVFCLTNKNSTFIMKQGDYISITGNSVYGAGPPKIAKSLNKSLDFAKKLYDTYWKRNKAVKQVASNVITKRVNNQLWLFNPVSEFWYSLRVEKDIFSVLNQGTGSYVEDRWIYYMRKKGIKIILQYHDEIATYLKKEDKELYKTYITESMEEVNKELKLNVPISVSLDFGNNYSQIH